jgi:integrase
MVRAKRPKREANKRRLTELAVRKLKSKVAPYQVWDTHQRGLAIRVQPTGGKSWKVIYSFHGRPRWLHLGDANAIGLKDARELAAEAMLAVAKGKDPAAEKRAERGAGTFAELADKYLEQHAKKHNKSWKQADALVKRYLLPRWAKLQAAAITRADMRNVMSNIEAPILANQVLAAASAIFTWGSKQEIIANNPARGVDRNPTRSRERILSDSEIPKFWRAFDDAGLVTSSALKVLLLCGQRPGEISRMRHEHVVDGWWQLPGEPVPALGWPGTKNGKSHRIWLADPVRALIEEASDRSTGFVFSNARGTAVTDLDAAMRELCAKLKLERATPHDLRRTFSSKVTGLTFGRDAMNRVTNHREGGIADVYDRHRYEAENKKIMETVAAHIMTLVEGKPAESNVVAMETRR